jgi:hypothetical protein
MVATYLARVGDGDPEAAEYELDYGWPQWSEVASVAALAVRLRLGTPGAPARYAAWGAAVRLAALVGLLGYAAGSLAGFGLTAWTSGLVPWLPAPPAEVLQRPPFLTSTLWFVEWLLWLAAFVSIVVGELRLGRVLAYVALVPPLVDSARAMVGSVSDAANVLTGLLLATSLVAFHRDTPPVRRGPWFACLAVGAAVVVGVGVAMTWIAVDWPAGPHVWILADWPGLWCLALVPVATGYLVASAVRPRRRVGPWPHALAMVGTVVFVLRLVTMLDQASRSGPTLLPLALGGAQAAAVAVVTVLLAVQAARQLRRLPAEPTDRRAWSGVEH